MEKITNRSKEYDLLTIKKDPAYNQLTQAILVVKNFIVDKGLIVYGGSAMDYALRLSGDKIYPDDLLAVPDLDMYSNDCVEHAYQLADLLYEKGYTSARAINAQHMETMRVDMGDNHFIADITYRPKSFFDSIPVLLYNSMKIVHPNFQKIDIHSSLSFPYDNSPREVIFDRWSKDVKRFNLLDKYYPIDVDFNDIVVSRKQTFPLESKHYVANGFFAYSIMYSHWVELMKTFNKDLPRVIVAHLEINDTIAFPTLDSLLEITSFEPETAVNDLALDNVRIYESYAHIVPEKYEGSKPGPNQCNVCVYSTKNRFVSINKVGELTTVNVQYLLRLFLALYYKNTGKLANTYLAHYQSLMQMISSATSAIVDAGALEVVRTSPLFLSAETYGKENINLAREVALMRLYHDLDGSESPVVPVNYKPANSIGKPHPSFNYNNSVYFRELGREKIML